MVEKIDWSKVEEESEIYLKKVQFVEKQIKEERKNPKNYDLKTLSDEVDKYLEKNNSFESVLKLDQKSKKGD